MSNLMWLLLLGLIWPFIAAAIWKTKISYQEVFLQMVAVSILTSSVWMIGTWSATQDTEVWNGQVISKVRTEGTYEQPYDCMCSTDSNGNRSCSTCYETHYTVDWSASTTVGRVGFKSLDSTYRSVYNTADPADYKRCFVGEPATISHSYVNYVQAVNDSLFSGNEALVAQYKDKIPNQPKVYSHYKYNRIIDQDDVMNADQEKLLDEHLDDALRQIGASHQVNIIVVLTKITDPNFKVAVENSWGGGEKNDVVVFIGADADGKVAWVEVMTWALNSGNELLQVVLRDELMEIPSIDASNVGQTIILNVLEHYTRPKMKDYEYLKDSIEPSMLVILLALFLMIASSAGLTYYFHKNDVDFLSGIMYTVRKKIGKR